MRKFTLFLITALLAFGYNGWGQVFITELADPNGNEGARFVEIYNSGASSIDLSTGWQLQRATNGNTYWATAKNLTGTISAGGFYVVCANQTTFTSTYGFAADQNLGTGGPADSNGDDQIRLLSPGSVVVDMFGVLGEDGSGTNHEFEDGRAERKATVTSGNTTYTFAEWNIWNDTGSAGTTNDPQVAPDDFDPREWIGAPASPTITVAPTSLTGFAYVLGNGPSSEQTFTVEGSDLTNDIVLTASTNYEISESPGAGYTTPITLTQSGGAVGSTTIYVRLKSGLSLGDYNSENVTVTSTGANQKIVTCSGSVIKGEPTNHVTGFSATANSTIVTLSWTENDGSIVPDGYLIKANTGTISEPSDGTDPSDDTDLTDGAGNVKVSHGVTSYSFLNCSPSTTYNFEIYPYTNSGSTIDFNIISAPSDAATTGATASEPVAGNLLITEVSGDDVDGTSDDGFMEIYNSTSGVISLSNVSARYYNGNPGTPSQTVSLSGAIAPEGFVIVTQNAANFLAEYGFNAEFYGSSFYFNGGDDGCDIYHSSVGILDQFNEVGVGSSPWTWNDDYSWDRNTTSSGTIEANWTSNTVSTPKSFGLAVWTGGTSSTWNDDDNWTFATPSSSTNVTIPVGVSNFPTLSTSGNCNNITIESTSSGNASILGNSNLTVSGTAYVERYFEAYAGSDDGWHFIGSPVNNMTIAGSEYVPGGSDDLFSWDEDDYLWRNYLGASFGYTSFENGVGFMVAYASNETNNFTGTLNTSNVSFNNLSKTTGKGEGWHLLGNPYASAIKWNDGNWTLTGASGVAKVYNESTGNYSDIAADGIIPSTNGFFIQVSSATNAIVIPAASRIHDATNNYKNTETENDETLQLVVNNDANNFGDRTTIGFREDAEITFDWAYDSHKMFGQNTAPQLWTLIEGEDYSTNNLPHVYESFTLPLNFKAGVSSTFHILAEGIESFYLNSEIYLEDIQTGDIVDLREQTMYTFNGQPSDDNARFILHFFGVTATSDIIDNKEVVIYGNSNRIFVKTKFVNQNCDIEVYDIMGRKLLSDNFNSIGLNSFDINGGTGVYIVKLKSSTSTHVEKINLR